VQNYRQMISMLSWYSLFGSASVSTHAHLDSVPLQPAMHNQRGSKNSKLRSRWGQNYRKLKTMVSCYSLFASASLSTQSHLHSVPLQPEIVVVETEEYWQFENEER
jgi:hypothetical protein